MQLSFLSEINEGISCTVGIINVTTKYHPLMR